MMKFYIHLITLILGFINQSFATELDFESIIGRSLYSVSKDGPQCYQCISRGSQHCWDGKTNGDGSWERGYCCGPSDSKCDDLQFCSKSVSGDLRFMSCPTDDDVCPRRSNRIVSIGSLDQKVSRSESWSEYEIFDKTFCKYKVHYTGQTPQSILKYNVLSVEIKLSSYRDITTYAVFMPDQNLFNSDV